MHDRDNNNSNNDKVKVVNKITDLLRVRTNPFSAVKSPPAFGNNNNSNSMSSNFKNATQSTLTTTSTMSKSNAVGIKRLPSQLEDTNDISAKGAEGTTPFSKTRRRELEEDNHTKSGLIVPKRHKPNHDRDLDRDQLKDDLISKNIDLIKAEAASSSNDSKNSCPFCYVHFPFVSKVVQDALDAIETKNKEYKEKIQADKEKAKGDSIFYIPDTLIQRPIPNQEKQDFCKLHKIEFIYKPEARKKGYPTLIRYLNLDQRVHKLKSELTDIVNGDLRSEYRDIALKAYDGMGTNKARSTHAIMARFEDLLPGYYGPKGGAIILDALTDIFLASSTSSRSSSSPDILTPKKAAPQLPQEYIQQVLIPETAYRLIKEDMKLDDDEEAKKIMKESVEYGEIMNPLME